MLAPSLQRISRLVGGLADWDTPASASDLVMAGMLGHTLKNWSMPAIASDSVMAWSHTRWHSKTCFSHAIAIDLVIAGTLFGHARHTILH